MIHILLLHYFTSLFHIRLLHTSPFDHTSNFTVSSPIGISNLKGRALFYIRPVNFLLVFSIHFILYIIFFLCMLHASTSDIVFKNSLSVFHFLFFLFFSFCPFSFGPLRTHRKTITDFTQSHFPRFMYLLLSPYLFNGTPR